MEITFFIAARYKIADLVVLLKGYDWNMISHIPIKQFENVIVGISKQNEKDKMWAMWLQVYPHMTKETFISFEKWIESTEYDSRPTSEIENELNDLEYIFSKKE